MLKHKNECLDKFKNWKIFVETQKDFRIKTLRTDNGLEFINDEFNELCIKHGIQRHRTVVKTPQQNGIAERMNRTLLNKVRCLLIQSGMPKKYWGEALFTACYLINRSPSRVINLKTPEELWNNKPPSLSHLKTFGSTAYVHNVTDKLSKRSIKCVLMGYQIGVKGYRLLSLENNKIIISRDVIFNELDFPFKRNEEGMSSVSGNNTQDKDMVQIEVEPSFGQLEGHDTEPETKVEVENKRRI